MTPSPGLSRRGLLTVALAVAVVVLLTIHRRNGPGPLTRAVAEYAVVAVLAGLLVAVPGGALDRHPAARADGAGAQAQASAAAGDDRPAVLQAGAKVVRAVTGVAKALAGAVRWLVELWRKADRKTEPTNGEAMTFLPLPPLPFKSSIWRSP